MNRPKEIRNLNGTIGFWKVVLSVGGVLLVGACDDDPIAVEQPDVGGDELGLAAAHAADDGGSVDNFRSRFAVTLEVEGDLEPHQTVTIWIEGVATEKLTGGEVRMRLPTMAAMDHAGEGNRPNYPIGKELPVVAKWEVPALDEGGTWKRSVAVKLPDKGYYHVAVDVDAQGPDDKWDPYVFDDGYGEAWLLVMDGGGRVTNEFDESVFDDNLVPQPGPFRTRYESRTATGADMTASAAGANGGSDSIGVRVGYYSGGSFHAASGAYVQAMYLDPGDWSGDIIIREVGESGLITFPCPEDEDAEYMNVAGSVPTTTEVNANHSIGSTQVDQDDCGSTSLFVISDKWYLPWRHLGQSIPRIDDHFDQSRSAVDYKYSSASGGGSYSRTGDKITFYKGGYWSQQVAGHEYGHALHNKSLGGTWSASRCGKDRGGVWKATSYECAFKEGFASYAGSIGRQQPGQWEKLRNTNGIPGKIEGHVAALFTDLIDSADEGDDRTNYPAHYVSEVLRTCRVDGSKRNDVSDFVWCLENRVSEIVHNSNFPGIGAPDNATEGASEPSDWDADDIRRTWIQNVGY